MATLGTLVGGAIGGFGRKPKIPQLPSISIDSVQRETISGNTAALPQAQQLATQADSISQDQFRRALEFALPGSFSQVQGNIGAQLRGELPPDIAQSIIRSATAAGYARGFGPRSGLGSNLVARNLGLTSLQQQQTGLQNLMGLAGMLPRFDATSMFFTPQQRLGFEINERDTRFEHSLLKSRIKAMPDPFKAALTQAIINDEQALLEMAGSVVGMAAGAGCWVAREVYGENNPMWLLFRAWLFEDAPKWFLKLYLRFGRQFAGWLKTRPTLKHLIRAWMTSRVTSKYAN